MGTSKDWFRDISWLGQRSDPRRSSRARAPRAAEEAGSATPIAALRLARSLAGEGRLVEASAAYWRIDGELETAKVLVEHAALLLQLGDRERAGRRAARALELQPGYVAARLIQLRIQRAEEDERRSSTP